MAVIGDDEEHGAGGQRGHEGAEDVVEPAVEIEEALMMEPRRIGILVPEVVVEPITLGDDGDEEVPWLVADKAQVHAAARLERGGEVVEERLRPLVRVQVIDTDQTVAVT